MEQPPTKMAKIDSSVDIHSPEQLKDLKLATVLCIVYIEAPDHPFSLRMLEAVKGNTDIRHLIIDAAKQLPREFLDALAHVLVTNTSISHVSFNGDHSEANADSTVRDCWPSDDYGKLIAAIAESQSLLQISMSRFLHMELEKAILEALQQKSTLTTFHLFASLLILKNPMAFAELLANGKSIGSLCLVDTRCVDQVGSQIRNGLRMSQTLKQVKVYKRHERTTKTFECVLEGLDGNQFVETLELMDQLNAVEALLLNKVVSQHKKLACLRVAVTADAVASLCEAVSQSRSLKEFEIPPLCHIKAISTLLQRSTSLQKLYLKGRDKGNQMEELALGLKVCKTLTSLSIRHWIFNVKGARALLEAVLVNHNLTEIIPFPTGEYCEDNYFGFDEAEKQKQQALVRQLVRELNFYLSYNKQGRSLIRMDVPPSVWPHVLRRAGSCISRDALYFFLRETPELVMHHHSMSS